MRLGNIQTYLSESNKDAEKDIFSDMRYICDSASFITECLRNGSDVMQLENGDIITTEKKVVTYKYKWDAHKCKFIRAIDKVKNLKRDRKLVLASVEA